MPRLMSVALTESQVRARTKTVTRRLGWLMLKPGDHLTLCRKVMGRRKGEPLERIVDVEVLSAGRERLDAITPEEVLAEGFPHLSPAEFVAFFCASHKGCEPGSEVTRIEWRYLDAGTSARTSARTSTRPILAVDVDGVLNALSNGTPPKGWEDHKVIGFRIRCNPSHGAALLALAAEHDAELTWCTTWEQLANEHIAPLVGLPSLPVVPMEPGRRSRKFSEYVSVGTTKAAAMRAYAGDRLFCWLDDEPDAASELHSCPVPHRVIRVDPRAGLQDHHLRKAAAWFTGMRAGAGREAG